MIVIEEKLRELFNLIPDIQINSNNLQKPYFSWGKKEELNRYILGYNKQGEQPYPLIWLMPEVDTYNYMADMVTRRVVLILATLEPRSELYNAQRYQGSYTTTLNPLTSYVVQALRNSTITRVLDSSDIKIFKEPNYSDQGENATIDKWDAVRIECDVEFNNNCLNTIKWI